MKIALILFLFLFITKNVYAEEYTMPYPGVMPGNKLYKMVLVKEKIDQFLYFGNFSQFTLHLKLADKYLVESKTLFEYRQFLLASNALRKSSLYIVKAEKNLTDAKKEGKDISKKKKLFHDAKSKHVEVLTKLIGIVPKEFNWTPEFESPTSLKLWDEIEAAVNVRK